MMKTTFSIFLPIDFPKLSAYLFHYKEEVQPKNRQTKSKCWWSIHCPGTSYTGRVPRHLSPFNSNQMSRLLLNTPIVIKDVHPYPSSLARGPTGAQDSRLRDAWVCIGDVVVHSGDEGAESPPSSSLQPLSFPQGSLLAPYFPLFS